ncbi:helix-turn-helix transcriptional regulator [Salininema proteolyticum]|uniref:Helix-turn-helix transcriptional regulator n=1 Tax=Salininema proteolyticum TaxID=1607685 RepID=A0ABV8TSH9_9ACTN
MDIDKLDDLNDLGKFLQARRARVSPAEVGLAEDARRRVPGLRREELALLAGVSVDYYTRLEQGRATRPSDQVLEAIARVLRLDDATRGHLHRLASRFRRSRQGPSSSVRPQLQTLLDRMEGFPALVQNQRQEVLASNRTAREFYGGFGWDLEPGMSFPHLLFEEASCEFFADWETCTSNVVGRLRQAAAEFPEDEGLASLIGELSIKYRRFSSLWAQAEVCDLMSMPVSYRHPLLGELTLHKELLAVSESPGQELVTLTASPGTADYDRLAMLGGADG